ncbi:MAG: M67 family metallopeptidase [Phycisphaerae bacterium]
MNGLSKQDHLSQLTTLVIRSQEWDRLVEQARACGGLECCGLLLGTTRHDRAEIQRVQPSPNVHPGDRTIRYQVDSTQILHALLDARRGGPDLLGFYHSHPMGSARPSRTDAESAWPGMVYLIVGVAGGPSPRLAAWRFDATANRFEPLCSQRQ